MNNLLCVVFLVFEGVRNPDLSVVYCYMFEWVSDVILPN